jgi:hypothetical protein
MGRYRRAYSDATVGFVRDEANGAQGLRLQFRLGVSLLPKRNLTIAAYYAYEDVKLGHYAGGMYDLSRTANGFGASVLYEAWHSKQCVWTLAPYLNAGVRSESLRALSDGAGYPTIEAFAGLMVRGGKPQPDKYCY